MNNEEQQEELMEAPALPENGPGSLLVKKREALGLSVQEVADALHITMHYVRALEADAHDKLPGDVFIKGYLRSYANLLALDPTVIVNVYLDYSSERANAALESSTRRRRHRNRNMPWIIVSGIAFVGMAIALWYFSSGTTANGAGTGAVTPRPANTVRSAGVAAILNEDAVPSSRALPAAEPQREQPVSLPSTQTAPSAPVSSVSTQDQSVDLLSDAPAINESSSTSIEPSSLVALTVLEQDVALPTAALAEDVLEKKPSRLIAIDGGGDDFVQITFSGESMVQVEDASDAQLYRDVRVAGDVLRISGTAPFDILLGDASHSELSFNGSKVDFSSSIRIDNSARLTIGL